MTKIRDFRLLLLVFALAGAAALFLLLRPAPSHGASSPTITLRVVPTNPGPLHACDLSGPPCSLDTSTQFMLDVTNRYPLPNFVGAMVRSQVPNSFDISSVHWKATVNGATEYDNTFTPPPNETDPLWTGHWASTVECPSGPNSCTLTGSPAVLPGEKSTAFWGGWVHSTTEPDGKYIWTFTLHGTLNGTPLDLTATRAIKMTR